MQSGTHEIQTTKNSRSINNSFNVNQAPRVGPYQNQIKPLPSYLLHRPKSIHKGHNKNYLQSHSTTSLSNCNKIQQINNTQSGGTNYSINIIEDIHDKNKLASNAENISININQNKDSTESNYATTKKQNKVEAHLSNHPYQHNKSATNISINQEVKQNYQTNQVPKHKQPAFIQKIQTYSKQSKSPITVRLNFSQKVDISKKQQQISPTFPQNTNDSPKKIQKTDSKQYHAILRQTLDPHIRNHFPQHKNDNKHSPLHYKKRQTEFNLSPFLKNRTPKNSTNISHNQSGSFWKNKAVSPPSKPLSPKKGENEQVSNLRIPPLPISNQKSPIHRPSFIANKKSLNRFNIIKQLGSGTYSDVFLCMDKKTNAIFCLKRYLKSTLKNLPSALDNFIKKIAFQHLVQHSHIVQLYDIFSDGEFVYTVEQYMESGKLYDVVVKQMEERQFKRRQTQNLSTASKESEQILFQESKIIDKIFDINSALCYIHQSQRKNCSQQKIKMPSLIHGDVKTKSILVSMGVCKLPSIEPMQAHIINSYSPPEQIIQQVYINKSDIWSLGLVLFQLCAQRRLFGNSQRLDHDQQQEVGTKFGYQIFNVNITDEIQKLPSITQLLKQLMKKMLSIKPEDRPSSDIVMTSNVFKMYGFDTDWKQRRNNKSIKMQETIKNNVRKDLSHQGLETVNQIPINFASFRKISNQSQGSRTQTKLTSTQKNVKADFQKKSNSSYTKQQEVHGIKQHWTSKINSHNI